MTPMAELELLAQVWDESAGDTAAADPALGLVEWMRCERFDPDFIAEFARKFGVSA